MVIRKNSQRSRWFCYQTGWQSEDSLGSWKPNTGDHQAPDNNMHNEFIFNETEGISEFLCALVFSPSTITLNVFICAGGRHVLLKRMMENHTHDMATPPQQDQKCCHNRKVVTPSLGCSSALKACGPKQCIGLACPLCPTCHLISLLELGIFSLTYIWF